MTMPKRLPRRYCPPELVDAGRPVDQEKRVAKALGGRRHSGSGASFYLKADASTPEFLIEAKQTEHGSISVKKEWLVKITNQALAVRKWPALAIEIRGGDDDAVTERDWVCVPLSCFKRLCAKGENDE
jgi:hypothetical protein